MGEIADMMLEGVLCEGCGGYLDAEPDGIPGYCSEQCARDRGADWWLEANGPASKTKREKTIPCEKCGKLFNSEYARGQHHRAKHGDRS